MISNQLVEAVGNLDEESFHRRLQHLAGELSAQRQPLPELLNLAALLVVMGRHQWAVELYQAICRQFGRSPYVVMGLGLSQLLAGRFEQSLHSFVRLQALMPSEPAVWFFSGVANMQAGRPDSAVSDFRRFLASSGPKSRRQVRLVSEWLETLSLD